MAKIDIEALKNKLLKFAGFTFGEYDRGNAYQPVFYPDGRQVFIDDSLDFPNSFDACFNWLVPKLKRLGFILYIHEYKKGWLVNFLWLEDIGYKRRQRVTNDKYESVAGTPALALCLAIEKLIDGH